MSLDTLLQVSLVRILDAKRYLEFGTGLGYNAFHLVLNTQVSVITVDGDRRKRVFEGEFSSSRIRQVNLDIREFEPVQADIVFCDINIPGITEHMTELAFRCNPKAIVWHDYGHPLVPHVKVHLDELAESKDLIHVEDSLSVFWVKDGFE
jgi:hypothetical protein